MGVGVAWRSWSNDSTQFHANATARPIKDYCPAIDNSGNNVVAVTCAAMAIIVILTGVKVILVCSYVVFKVGQLFWAEHQPKFTRKT
jgi:hypothetical protein